jgi:SHS2 domain-containing protein
MSSSLKYFEHTADVGMEFSASTIESAIAVAGMGLAGLLVGDPQVVPTDGIKRFEVDGRSPEYGLVDLLRELLYMFESEGLIWRSLDVRLDDSRWLVSVNVARFDADRHCRNHEVKAITYSDLAFREENGAWRGRVIVDI